MPPNHLNARATRLWKEISEGYELGPDHRELLLRLAEAVTRLDQLRKTLDSSGLVCKDRFGQERGHPLLQVEVQTRAQVARLLDQLGLDPDEAPAREIRAGASALAKKRWRAQ